MTDNSIYQPLLRRLIWVESRNNPRAVSHKGAIGLAQITKPVLDDYNTFAGGDYSMTNMFVPFDNIKVAKWQLRRLWRMYSNDFKVINAYNMGNGNTDKNIYNVSYMCDILGTNEVVKWLRTKNITQDKYSWRLYHVSNR